MAVIETWLRQDLKGLVSVRSLQGQVFSLDNGGNLIGVKVTKDGKPVTLTGTVTGYCILSDGQTVTVTGSGSSGIQNGNEAYIVLPQLVYSVPGQISIVIKLTSGSVTTTLAACTGYVYRSRTSNEVVPPGTPIPDLATMEEVIQRATAATDAANTAATGAEKVDASMTKEGDVITIAVTDRDGNVMTETMTDTASDVSELKSAFEQLNDNVIVDSAGPAPIVSIADGADGMPMRKVEVAIEPVQDLHGYDSPWPAGGGKNLLRNSAVSGSSNGITWTVNNDGSITFSGTASADVNIAINNVNAHGYAPVSSGTLTLVQNNDASYNPSITGLNFQTDIYVDGTKVNTLSNTVTSRQYSGVITAGVSRLHIDSGTVIPSGTVYYPMIEIGSTPSAYAPYSNICPITGWTGAKVTRTGKNLWGGEKMANDSVAAVNSPTRCSKGSDADGEYVKLVASSAIDVDLTFDVKFKANTQYTFILKGKRNNTNRQSLLRFRYTDGTSTEILLANTVVANTIYANAVTSTAGKTIKSIFGYYASGESYLYYEDCGLFEGVLTADQFEPYQGQTYEVAFPADPGTVYGGTLDVVSGKLVVDHFLYVYEGTEPFSKSPTALNGFYNQLDTYTPHASWPKMKAYKGSLVTDERSSMFVPTGNVNVYKQNYGYVYLDSGHNFNVSPEVFGTTVESFKAKLAELYAAGTPVSVFAKILTPVQYQLTPQEIKTLLGTNNIWSDAGSTAITYPADTKMYIDNRINSTRKLIAGIETGFVASKAYAVGDMLIIGDDLYKVASVIASGATITVGTNVTKTTVAEQLIALANA